MKKVFLTLLACIHFFCGAQEFTMSWPLDTPCIVTGNYGELRPNHFHAGVDFSTGGRVNRSVYAAEAGFVSRVRVSATGYGNAVYITHPGSRVTVYAHLNSLSLKLSTLVREEQLARRSFEVELLPAPNSISVKKGELIGLSGNTGGSSGPHLHFEIRDEKSETPLNPLFYYRISDRTAPKVEAIGFYDLTDSLNPVLMRVARIHEATVTQTFVVSKNPIGVAFSGYDQVRKDGNKNNIYSAGVFFDDKLVYAHRLRAIDFADNRFVNEFSEVAGKHKLQKCFVPTLFPPRLYDAYINKGIITFNDTALHSLRFIFEDESGNKTVKEFFIRTSAPVTVRKQDLSRPLFVDCSRDFWHREGDLYLYIPASTFYRSVQLKVENNLSTASRLVIGPAVNMRTALVVGCRIPANYLEFSGKLVLRSQAGTVTGVTRNDSVFFYPKSTGTFYLQADTEAPAVRTALSAKRLRKMRQFSSFAFRIEDKVSGIGKYAVYVNGEWVLAAFDAKNDLLTYTFDDNTPRGPLSFLVEVEDRCGNKRKFTYRLVR